MSENQELYEVVNALDADDIARLVSGEDVRVSVTLQVEGDAERRAMVERIASEHGLMLVKREGAAGA